MDTIPSDYGKSIHKFKLEIPLGQTFINPGCAGTYSVFRSFRPDIHSRPQIISKSSGDVMITNFSWDHGKSQSFSTVEANSASGTVYQYQYRVAGSVNSGDPENYLMELSPDPAMATQLDLNLGYGSARLDLSDLSISQIDLVAGATDVIISYKKPNRTEMKSLNINGGMSRIVLRNLDMARANSVRVENGMGTTKIIMGNAQKGKSAINLEVGAGNCIFMMQKDIPVKIILSQTFFSSVQVPQDFLKTDENTYVNLAYQSNPSSAKTIYVDLGIGTFTLIAFE